MLPINITRNGAVSAKEDALTAGFGQNPLRFSLNFFFRALIQQFRIQVAKTA